MDTMIAISHLEDLIKDANTKEELEKINETIDGVLKEYEKILS